MLTNQLYDILPVVATYFNREDLLFSHLVCKRWNSLIPSVEINRRSILRYYAKYGSISTLQFVRNTINSDDKFFTEDLFDFATKDVLEWSLSQIQSNKTWLEIWCYGAAKSAQYDLLAKLYHMNLLNKAPKYLCIAAAESGNLDILEWASDWLAQNHIQEWDIEMYETLVCSTAAQFGHLDALKWARNSSFPWDSDTCYKAASGGHFEVLKWAHDNGCKWDARTCSAAAALGNLEMLKWAREKGCPWDHTTCLYATQRGQLDVLKWARENGCPE